MIIIKRAKRLKSLLILCFLKKWKDKNKEEFSTKY